MIGLDTNVLLRLFDSTIRCKARSRTHLVRTQGGAAAIVNAIVLSEFAWTLARSYKESREVIAAHLA